MFLFKLEGNTHKVLWRSFYNNKEQTNIFFLPQIKTRKEINELNAN